ncbi:MAG: nicotianamine synthase family protein, partial [Pseudomonadota bacterium]
MNDNPTPDHGRAAKIDLARFRSARRGHEPSIDHDQADRIIQTIKTAADTLNAQTDLSPANPKITEVLSRLVKAVTEPTNPATAMHVLGNREIRTVQKQLWENLSRAEGEMEAWWTTQFLRERKLDLNTLEQFWYRDNYKELTQLEVDHWAQQNKRPDADSHVVFV